MQFVLTDYIVLVIDIVNKQLPKKAPKRTDQSLELQNSLSSFLHLFLYYFHFFRFTTSWAVRAPLCHPEVTFWCSVGPEVRSSVGVRDERQMAALVAGVARSKGWCCLKEQWRVSYEKPNAKTMADRAGRELRPVPRWWLGEREPEGGWGCGGPERTAIISADIYDHSFYTDLKNSFSLTD